jgi:Flp pilus assembly pilin Flp
MPDRNSPAGKEQEMRFAEAFRSLRREQGQTMAEYGVVLAVITIGAVAVFTALSGGITNAINTVIGFLPG